jgi:flavin-dependent dehydrogenase
MTPASAVRDVLIIGAGPSGSVAGALLAKSGLDVTVLERASFPRFSIGESLLPYCMTFIEEAGMLRAVVEAGYQHKNGAVFTRAERNAVFDFRDKVSPGWGSTYQVPRAEFDQLLANEAIRSGAEILFERQIVDYRWDGRLAALHVRNADGSLDEFRGRFVLDASGFGRVLPRLLQLERPSEFPLRRSVFTHVRDRIDALAHDRSKILIAVHPANRGIWYWLIPFANGRCSIGVVAADAVIESVSGSPADRLRTLVGEEPTLRRLLADADFDTTVREIRGYAANVSTLTGPGFALLGNAGEFLDPIFSSGVTIAMKSSSLAAALVRRQLAGETVDWDVEFAAPLKQGVDTFRAFVASWYDGALQDIVFFEPKQPQIKQMVCSVLAGYAWDTDNPYVANPTRRLATLAELCGN